MSNPDPEPGGFPLLAIGAVAELAGKPPSSIRYYEQIGLLPPPVRVSGQAQAEGGPIRRPLASNT